METAATSTLPSAPRQAGALALSIALALGAGALGGWTTDAGWYASLDKPVFAPPGWIFGPVWTLLYFAMGTAAWWVWRTSGWRGAAGALSLYGVQLALNAAWTPIFFGLREMGWAFAELLALWVAIVATLVAFWRHRRGAGLLLVPYLLWVTFAGVLNLRLWQLQG
jgi:tryptophan-rich sensory protein